MEITQLLKTVHSSWLPFFHENQETLSKVISFITDDAAAGHPILPQPEWILRPYATALNEIKVLIVGQDPYPNPSHAVGYAFSVAPEVKPLPASLRNIYQELKDDLDISRNTGDLSAWCQQGVMLLNRTLTVRAGEAGSHQKHGWEQLTTATLKTLAARRQPLVAVLWGKPAQELAPLLPEAKIITSAHPSPLAAYRGFFGSKPFSQVNTYLKTQGLSEINWAAE